MPPVGDLEGLRGAAGGTVAADESRTRAASPARLPGVGLAVRQQVHRATCLDVDDHGSVDPASAGCVDPRQPRGVAAGGSGNEAISRNRAFRLTGAPKASAIWAPVRPARPTDASLKRSFRPPYRRVSPGTCSAKVRRGQELSTQVNLRTRNDSTMRLPAVGKSPGNRRQEPCIRIDQRPQPGQAAPAAVVRACVRATVSATSTDTTDTPSTDENSDSSSCGRTSITPQHCRPRRTCPGRFSGDLPCHHMKINGHALYATTRSGPELPNGSTRFAAASFAATCSGDALRSLRIGVAMATSAPRPSAGRAYETARS
jgi:hypothetical protein